ncbi:hypothetical protein ScPMuIL_016664 [Solemya velum]
MTTNEMLAYVAFLILVKRGMAVCDYNTDGIAWCDLTFFSATYSYDEAECICQYTGRQLVGSDLDNRLTEFLGVIEQRTTVEYPVWIDRTSTPGTCRTADSATTTADASCLEKNSFICEHIPGSFTCFHPSVVNFLPDLLNADCSDFGEECLASTECIGVYKECPTGSMETCKVIPALTDTAYIPLNVQLVDTDFLLIDDGLYTNACPPPTTNMPLVTSPEAPTSTAAQPETTSDSETTTHVSETPSNAPETTTNSFDQETTDMTITDSVDDVTIATEVSTFPGQSTSAPTDISSATDVPLTSTPTATEISSLNTDPTTAYSEQSTLGPTTTVNVQTEANICMCSCALYNLLSQNITHLTSEEAMLKAIKLNAELKAYINIKNMSSYKNTKISAEDNRPSAQSIGYLGIVLLSVVFGDSVRQSNELRVKVKTVVGTFMCQVYLADKIQTAASRIDFIALITFSVWSECVTMKKEGMT